MGEIGGEGLKGSGGLEGPGGGGEGPLINYYISLLIKRNFAKIKLNKGSQDSSTTTSTNCFLSKKFSIFKSGRNFTDSFEKLGNSNIT